jgi:hypothetical protein
MNSMKENETFILSKPAAGVVIGERRNFALSAGTPVTVVSVFGDENAPEAYEVEAFLSEEDLYVLATIDAQDVG